MTALSFSLKLCISERDIRRIAVDVASISQYKYADFARTLRTLAPEVRFVKWRDSDGDKVRLRTDSDLADALQNLESGRGRPLLTVFPDNDDTPNGIQTESILRPADRDSSTAILAPAIVDQPVRTEGAASARKVTVVTVTAAQGMGPTSRVGIASVGQSPHNVTLNRATANSEVGTDSGSSIVSNRKRKAPNRFDPVSLAAPRELPNVAEKKSKQALASSRDSSASATGEVTMAAFKDELTTLAVKLRDASMCGGRCIATHCQIAIWRQTVDEAMSLKEMVGPIIQVEDSIPHAFLSGSISMDKWRKDVRAATSFGQLSELLAKLRSCINWNHGDADPACRICHSKGDAPNMLMCDLCNHGYHLYCLTPPLKRIPKGDWHCEDCKSGAAKPSSSGRTPVIKEESDESEEGSSMTGVN